jgi:hypothetical protein
MRRMALSYNLFLLPHSSSYLSPPHNYIAVVGSCPPDPFWCRNQTPWIDIVACSMMFGPSAKMNRSLRLLVETSRNLVEVAAV